MALLREASPASGPDVANTKDALVRYQWDPERNVRSEQLPYRSLQLGISGSMASKWIDEWIVGIEDITEDVRRWKGCIDKEGKNGVRKVKREIERTWNEAVFEVGEELEVRLGMRESDEGGPGVDVATG